jgi:hypothetical protein
MVLMSIKAFGGSSAIQNQGFNPVLSANPTDAPELPTELLLFLIRASCYLYFKS